MKHGAMGAVLALVATAVSAQPAQACWTKAEAEAATVANLNMMMMVSALRCRLSGEDFVADYNRFVKSNNDVLGSHHAVLRGQFAKISGAKAAESEMDRYVTGLANGYGGGVEGKSCSDLRNIAFGMTGGFSLPSLVSFAESVVGTTPLPGGRCETIIAAR